jgi:hypothetical protein
VHYDLWDELYYIQWEQGHEKVTQKVSSQRDVFKYLSSYTFSSILPLEIFNKKENVFSISFGLVIDPITKAKRKKIKEWLANNKVNTPSSQVASLPEQAIQANLKEISTSGSIVRGLFGKILESELGEEIDAASWSWLSPKITIISKDIINEK